MTPNDPEPYNNDITEEVGLGSLLQNSLLFKDMKQINPKLRAYIISSIITFVTAFFIILGAQLKLVGTEHITGALLGSTLVTAGRGALKALIESMLGGTPVAMANR